MSEDKPKISRQQCILSVGDGLERAQISLKLWTETAETTLEKRVIERLHDRVKEMITQINSFS